jgi:hypothetical protein
MVSNYFTSFYIVAYLTGILATADTALAAGPDGGSAPADQFKHFMETPPPIEDMFIEHQAPEQPSSFYHVKWQPDCMFIGCGTGTNIESLQSATNLVDYYTIYSKFKDVYWQKVGADLYVWTNQNIPQQQTNSITFANNNYAQIVLNPAMNGGIDMMPVGSLRWAGDTLSFSKAGYKYAGTLHRDESGRATNMTLLAYKMGMSEQEVTFSNDYFYDAALSLSFFPSRLEWHATVDNGASFSHTTIIHSLKLAGQLMPKDAFSLETLLSTTNINNLITESSNDLVIRALNPARGVIPESVMQDPIAPPLHVNYRKRYAWLAIIILCAPLLIILANMAKRRRSETEPDNKSTKKE